MSTHYAEFMKHIEGGGKPNIYALQPEGKNYYRLYDGNSRFSGNETHHACVASKLSEEEANAAAELSSRDPQAFADAYL